MRETFRRAVFDRDGYRCKICDDADHLTVHHITDPTRMPRGGCHVSNGITLCASCQEKAAKFHRTGGTDWTRGMHPQELYRLVNSDYDTAYLSCRRYLDSPCDPGEYESTSC